MEAYRGDTKGGVLVNESEVLKSNINIELLEFDKKNPRLPTSVRNKDDASILKYLATKNPHRELNDVHRGEWLLPW